MKVEKRLLSSKRHCLGYKVSGKWRSREEVYGLAMQGRVDGVIACKSRIAKYIQSHPGTNARMKLYNLPAVIEY